MEPCLADADVQDLFDEASNLIDMGDAMGAQNLLRQILRARPCMGQAHASLAHVLAQQGCMDEAELHYRRALMLVPPAQLPRVVHGFGTMLMTQQRPDEAQALYLQGLQWGQDEHKPFMHMDRPTVHQRQARAS